jgi:polysaccharide export outer membrane protein
MYIFSLIRNFLLTVLLTGGFALMLSSCGNTRHLTYIQGQFDTARMREIKIKEPIVQKGDILGIMIYSDNPGVTGIFNQAQSSTSGGAAAAQSSTSGSTPSVSPSGGSSGSGPGYLVDEKGNIELQVLGLVHVDGLSRSQLKELLETKLKEYLTNPYCTIRFLNYKFTILGEVGHPGILSIPGEHINLLEAIAVAGDISLYGRRDNVLIIRENNGQREWARLDLTKPEIMASPYFYLQPNDLVYVEATKKKVADNDQSTLRTISITTSIVSLFVLLYTVFKK